MGEQRINPETGVVEENVGFIFDDWQPAKNDQGNAERVNPETGVREEDQSVFGGALGYDWQTAKNDQGNAERVNPETGVREEDQSVFGGSFGYDWQTAKNEGGNAERLNPESGTHEEDQSVFGGTFGYDWQTSKNEQGNAERVNPETGVHEEDQSIFKGFFGHDWQPSKTGTKRAASWGFPGGTPPGSQREETGEVRQEFRGNVDGQASGHTPYYSGYYAAPTATSSHNGVLFASLILGAIVVIGLFITAIYFSRIKVDFGNSGGPPIQPETRQEPRSVGIASIGAEAASLRFFDSAGESPARGQRVYSNSFEKSQTRYIEWELNLKHPRHRGRIDFVINAIWYSSDNTILAQQALQTYLKPDWTTSYHNLGWGWGDTGLWQIGTYRVDLFIDGNRVSSGSFHIYENDRSELSQLEQPKQPLLREPVVSGDHYSIRLFNCDDGCRALVNGRLVAQSGFGDDTGWIDITEHLELKANGISLQVVNNFGAITYGFQIRKNGSIMFERQCGTHHVYGCENNRQDFPTGLAREFSLTIEGAHFETQSAQPEQPGLRDRQDSKQKADERKNTDVPSAKDPPSQVPNEDGQQEDNQRIKKKRGKNG